VESENSGMGWFRTMFRVAAWYDIVLGLAFFFFWRPILGSLGVPLPENTSYLHIATAYVFTQGVSYWFVSRDMLRNIDMVKVGVIYKAIYVGLAIYYVAIGQLPHVVFAWFAGFDFIFLALFLWFLSKASPTSATGHASA
jgi:hypothetical protein